MSDEKKPASGPVVIKKYANRRLYNTATSSYVTLDDLSQMVKQGTDFTVADAKTGEDITRSVLTQIIFEEESKGTTLLPINFLRQLIRFYGDQMQTFVPGFLEMSLGNLAKEQGNFSETLAKTWGADPFKAMEEHAKRNMAMFNNALGLFNPFAAMGGPGQPPKTPDAPQPAGREDLRNLQEQLAMMQRKLEQLAGGK